MQNHLSVRQQIMIGVVGLILSLGCGSIFEAGSEGSAGVPPTRTPLPTFTATPADQPPLVEVLIPTDTPPPSPTPEPPTPEPPTPEPSPTESPEPTPTETPPPPTDTPVPPPPPPAPPTEPPPPPPPPPPAAPVAGPSGVIGKITFREGRNTYGVGEQVFVKIEATNTGAGEKEFGILGLNTSTGTFQTSWDNSSIGAGQTFTHEDGVAFTTPGTHKLWLSVCYSDKETCQGPNGDWERYEPGLDVVIQ